MSSELAMSLDQHTVERWFCDEHGCDRWTTLYRRSAAAESGIGLYACLIAPRRRAQALQTPGWELLLGSGGPGFSQEGRCDAAITRYHRWSSLPDAEPLVILREFHHGRPSYMEIAEELRLLFNLFEDRLSGSFYEAQEDGSETEVIRIFRESVEIRSSLLRRYLAARQRALVLQIDAGFWADLVDGGHMPTLPPKREATTDDYCFHFHAGVIGARRLFSSFLGKKIILPPPRSECGLWPFEKPKQYLDFIIDEDERGIPIEQSCDPELLANYFGKNRGAPQYLTPVFFQREVLRKYYENSDRYEVEDGGIRCATLWLLRADTNHADHVVVYLGDLGRDLPFSEQRHWRSYNIPPEGRTLSTTAFRRDFLGEFADADLAEHRFKYAYAAVDEAWRIAFGWPLFKELHPDDRHVLRSLRLPLANTASEFDSQILHLAKLVVDSLNEEQIIAPLQAVGLKDEKGIAKFERLLTVWQYPHVARDIALLRTIQGIRSRGAAHRKGSDYDLAASGLDPKNFFASFRQLLDRTTEMLSDLETFAKSRQPLRVAKRVPEDELK